MWQKLIEDLLEEGLKEQEIASRVNTTQPTVNRLKRGHIGSPRHALGQALIDLHTEVCKPKRRPMKVQEARA